MNDTPLESSSQDTHVPFDERSQIPTPGASNLSKAAEVKKCLAVPTGRRQEFDWTVAMQGRNWPSRSNGPSAGV